MRGEPWSVGSIGASGRIVVASAIAVAGAACGGSGSGSHADVVGSGPDGREGACEATTALTESCGTVATGTITACGQDSGGQPSQTGYLEVQSPDGSKTYVCATSWTPDG